jgi:2-polyprenyl-6-methoxyphenol hydroxylase-like FAD-dependent oxidoreductase
MSSRRNGHAVVVGGSMAGLLAARALSEHFDEVTVIERDRLPEQPEFRKGVPHSRHLHVFWVGGLSAVERLLPGFEGELLAAGAQPLRLPTDLAWLNLIGLWAGRFPATQRTISASRTLIEWTLRRRILQVKRIHVVPEHEVTALRLDPAGDVHAVVVRSRRTGTESDLSADLVVDASGRGSGLPRWLAALGRPRPRESTVDAFTGYATRYFAIPAGIDADWRGIILQAAPPQHPRSGVLLPVEGNQWIVTVVGSARDYPPTDEAGFLAFARSLRDPVLYDAIAEAEPVSPVWGYRNTANHRRHYESLRDMPGRLLVIGDSLCAFNPVYAQGMTVAALQVEVLNRLLRDRAPTHRAQQALAKVADAAWLISTGEDLRYPSTVGAKPTMAARLTHTYLDHVLAAAATIPTASAAFLRVLNMIDKPTALLRPRILAAALLQPHRQQRGGLPNRPLTPAVPS